MAEKKQVLYDLRISYNGPFLVEDFYKEVDDWTREKGFEKEHKKKSEHVTKNGKKIEWVTEIHSHLDELNHGDVILRALFDNVKELTITRNGRKIRINNGDALININGFIESHIHGSFYQAKPVYYFIRTLLDRFIYNFWADKYDGAVNSDCRDLYKRIRNFFSMQRIKYE